MDLIFFLMENTSRCSKQARWPQYESQKGKKTLCDSQKALVSTVLKKPREMQKWWCKHHQWLRCSLLLKTQGPICQVPWDISWMPIPNNWALTWGPWAALVMSVVGWWCLPSSGEEAASAAVCRNGPHCQDGSKIRKEAGGNSGERLRKGRVPSKAFLEKRKEQKHCWK